MGSSLHRADYVRLINTLGEPSVSVYLPVESSPPERRQNPVRYRNLVKAVEARLRNDYPQDATHFVDTLRELDTADFWGRPGKGLAVFLSQDMFEVHRIPFELPELVVVADTFHTRPLLKYVATEARYHVLAVSQDHVSLFNGWREFLTQVDAPGLPQHMKDVVGETETESQRHVHSAARGGRRSIYHTPGEGSPDTHHNLGVFFRKVDAEVRRLLRNSGRPVVLAGQARNQAIYRGVSRLKFLISDGIASEAKDLSAEEIGKRAWPLIEKKAHDRLRAGLEAFQKAKSRGHGADDLRDVARKAVQGRVKLLLVGPSAPLWGHLDRSSGKIRLEREAPGSADIVEDLAELVLQRGGDVRIWEGEPFPVSSQIVASIPRSG